MKPSRHEIEVIKSLCEGIWNLSNAELAERLNQASCVNPRPAQQVPAPFTVADIVAKLGQESARMLTQFPHLFELLERVHEMDRAMIESILLVLAGGGLVRHEEVDAVRELLAETHADPDHPASISPAQLHLGRPVDSADLNIARHSS